MTRLMCWLKRDHQWMFTRLQRECLRCGRKETFIYANDEWTAS